MGFVGFSCPKILGILVLLQMNRVFILASGCSSGRMRGFIGSSTAIKVSWTASQPVLRHLGPTPGSADSTAVSPVELLNLNMTSKNMLL